MNKTHKIAATVALSDDEKQWQKASGYSHPDADTSGADPANVSYLEKRWGIESDFASKIAVLQQQAKEQLGLDMIIEDGRRTIARENTIGKGVQHVAGGTSFHNFGEAIDYYFKGVDRDSKKEFELVDKVNVLADTLGIHELGRSDSQHLENAKYKSWKELPKEQLNETWKPDLTPEPTPAKNPVWDASHSGYE